ANVFSQFGERDIGVVDVLAQDLDQTGGGDVTVAFIDAVKTAEEGGLAAAAGADERGDEPVPDVEGHLDQRLELRIPQAKIAGGDAIADRVAHPKIPFT